MTQKMLEMPNSNGLAVRLKEVIGKESVSSFSRRCGLGEGLLRHYLAGSVPGTDKLLALAATAGVTIEWLATGVGSKNHIKQPPETLDTVVSRDVAIRVTKFIEDHYGDKRDDPDLLDGLWLAMQMIGGPGKAAAALRYCGVNFVNR